MPLTPATLTRHELIGLPVRVADARSSDHVGIAGRVVSESMRTLVVRGPEKSVSGDGDGSERSVADRRVPKTGTSFEFALPDPEDSVAAVGSIPTRGTTDEAAAGREASGSTFELPWDTPGTGSTRPAGQSGGCEDVVYVTVDGDKLLSRPAFRTERAGDSIWQPD